MRVEQQSEALQKDSAVQLCSVRSGQGIYGVETRAIREVLSNAQLQRVPLAPEYIAGVLTYRGEVLEAVSLRTLLGSAAGEEGRVLIVEDRDGRRFALMVDSVGGMVSATESASEANPATLEPHNATIFNGVFRMDAGLMVRLEIERLRPAELANTAASSRVAEGRKEYQ